MTPSNAFKPKLPVLHAPYTPAEREFVFYRSEMIRYRFVERLARRNSEGTDKSSVVPVTVTLQDSFRSTFDRYDTSLFLLSTKISL